MTAPPQTVTLTFYRNRCETCGFSVSAITIEALKAAKREHEAYSLWLASQPEALMVANDLP